MAFPVGARTNIPSRHAYPDGLTLILYPQTTGRPHFAGRPQRRHKRNDFPGMQRHMYGDSSKSTSYSALEWEYTPVRQLPWVGSTTYFISHHTQDFSAALHKNDDRAFDMTHRQSHAVGGMQRSTSTPWKELTVHGPLDKPPQARLQNHCGVQFRLQVRRVIRGTVKRATTAYSAFARTPMELYPAQKQTVSLRNLAMGAERVWSACRTRMRASASALFSKLAVESPVKEPVKVLLPCTVNTLTPAGSASSHMPGRMPVHAIPKDCRL